MGLGLKDLRVWQEATALAAEVTRAVRQTFRREVRVVLESAMLTAMEVAEHIAQGHSRFEASEQREWYRHAKRGLITLETQLAVLRNADLLAVTNHAQLVARIQTVNRLLSGFLVYLDRQVQDTPPAEA